MKQLWVPKERFENPWPRALKLKSGHLSQFHYFFSPFFPSNAMFAILIPVPSQSVSITRTLISSAKTAT
jgi:hypothetical protein